MASSIRPPAGESSAPRPSWQAQGQRLCGLLAEYVQERTGASQRRSNAWQRCTRELGSAVTRYLLAAAEPGRGSRAPSVAPAAEAAGRKPIVTHSASAG